MNGAFYIGATGLNAQQRGLEVTANNIANINTAAFKRSELRFSELMAAGPPDPTAEAGLSPTLAGVDMDSSRQVLAQGELKVTGKAADIAIAGEGFIELMGADGRSVLWRGGALRVNADGLLAASNGMPLKGMIAAPAGIDGLAIGRDGQVTAAAEGQPPSVVGQIDLVVPRDPLALHALADGLYETTAADLVTTAPDQEGAGALIQGSVELSNVQLSEEMVTLLLLQRAYGANAQVVQAGDQLMGIVNNLRR